MDKGFRLAKVFQHCLFYSECGGDSAEITYQTLAFYASSGLLGVLQSSRGLPSRYSQLFCALWGLLLLGHA